MVVFEECKYNWHSRYRTEEIADKEIKSSIFPDTETRFKFQLHAYKPSPILSLKVLRAPIGTVKIVCNVLRFRKDTIIRRFSFVNKRGYPAYEHELLNDNIIRPSSNFNSNFDFMVCVEIHILAISCRYFDTATYKCSTEKLLASLVDDRDFSDLKIRTGSREFMVHKNILASASPIFRAYMMHDTLERNSSCIEIKGFEDNAVEMMINIIYRGSSENLTYNSASELLKISDIYDIQIIKEYITKYFETALNQTNALQICLLADINNATNLKNRAMNYILQTPQSYTLKDYQEMVEVRPSLLAELLVKLARN